MTVQQQNCKLSLTHPGEKVEQNKDEKTNVLSPFLLCSFKDNSNLLYETKMVLLKNSGRNIMYSCIFFLDLRDAVQSKFILMDLQQIGGKWETYDCYSFWPPYILVSSSEPL